MEQSGNESQVAFKGEEISSGAVLRSLGFHRSRWAPSHGRCALARDERFDELQNLRDEATAPYKPGGFMSMAVSP